MSTLRTFTKKNKIKKKDLILVQGYIHINYSEFELIPIDIINIIILFYHILLIWHKEWIQSNLIDSVEYISDTKIISHGRTQLYADYVIKSNEHNIFSWNIIFDKIDNFVQFGFVKVTDDNKPNIKKQGYNAINNKYLDQLHNNRGYVSYFNLSSNSIIDNI